MNDYPDININKMRNVERKKRGEGKLSEGRDRGGRDSCAGGFLSCVASVIYF